VPFVPTDQLVVEEMLKLAQLNDADVLYDLGSGDGRIVITAAKRYGARGVGVDIDPDRVRDGQANAKQAGVENQVRFVQADLFDVDLRPATAVTLYLLPEVNLRLRPKLLRELAPGTPVVSHSFDMQEWKPDRTVTTSRGTIYAWLVPANVAGTWRLAAGDRQYTVELQQRFQEVTGIAQTAGATVPLANVQLVGSHLSFDLPQSNGRTERFSGQIDGTTIHGKNGQTAWEARRQSASRG
jgi:hypothetical protein